MEPPPPGTVVLRPPRWVRPVGPMVTAFFAVAAGSALLGPNDDLPTAALWVVGVGCTLLALVLGYASWAVPRRSFHVSAHDVAVWSGERELFRLPYAQLSRVRPYLMARQRLLGMSRRALALTGTAVDGTTRTLRVFHLEPSLRPLLETLQPVLLARPELLPGEAERHLFDLFLLEEPAGDHVAPPPPR